MVFKIFFTAPNCTSAVCDLVGKCKWVRRSKWIECARYMTIAGIAATPLVSTQLDAALTSINFHMANYKMSPFFQIFPFQEDIVLLGVYLLILFKFSNSPPLLRNWICFKYLQNECLEKCLLTEINFIWSKIQKFLPIRSLVKQL